MRWGLLVRISDDRAGEGAGVGRQEEDGRAEVARRGGSVVRVYRENDTSAFKRRVVTLPDGRRARRVVRPEFRRALDDLYCGEIDGLMAYDLDRFVRDPRDLEDAIDVVEDSGRPSASVTGSLDLSTDHGITMARMMVAVANKASRDTARRVARAHLAVAEAGRPSGGRRPYGYTADRREVVPEEAAVLRELAARRLSGEGWVSLLRDLNERGIPAASGGRWGLSNISKTLLKPHIAGVRTLHGREVAEGVWPAILDRGTWEQLVAMQQERRPPTRRYLLSGIARCGLCGAGLGGRLIRGVAVYRCANPGCMRISRRVEALDAFVVAAALEMLADLDLTPPPAAGVPAAGEVPALQRRRAAVVAAFADVDGGEPVELRQALARIDEQLDRATTAAAGTQRERLLGPLIGVSPDQWDALPLDRRRATLTLLLRVVVHRSKRGRGFDPVTVELLPV